MILRRRTSRYSRTPIDMPPIVRLWMLRLLVPLGGHREFILRTGFSNDTLAEVLGLEEWIAAHHPDAIAVERVFAQHNVTTVIGTAQAAGVALLVAARHGIPATQHTPSEVKAAISGSGRADKAQVGLMVARILKLSHAPKPADAADAVALAICHAWRGAAAARLTGRRCTKRTQPSTSAGARYSTSSATETGMRDRAAK